MVCMLDTMPIIEVVMTLVFKIILMDRLATGVFFVLI